MFPIIVIIKFHEIYCIVKYNVSCNKISFTPVCNLKVLHEVTEVISAFVHSMVEVMQTVALIDLFHHTQLLLDPHCEQFELSDNRHDISLESHQEEIEIITTI